MDSRKRKAIASQSEEGSEKVEQMKRIYEQIRKKINDLNKELLTIADMKSNLDAGEVLLSWKLKRPDLISDHAYQKTDDCWAHAIARGLSAVMKQHGSTKNLPTADLLLSQIEKKFLTKTNGLDRVINAAPSILHNYGYEIVVHHRPKLELLKENEEFEKFIERRLAINQVAMCFHYVPGYPRFQHKNKAVFRPNVIDIQAMQYESLDDHCAVITGRGVVFRGDEAIDFWEIQETRGGKFGDGGFTQLERYKGLIKQVYEFKL